MDALLGGVYGINAFLDEHIDHSVVLVLQIGDLALEQFELRPVPRTIVVSSGSS